MSRELCLCAEDHVPWARCIARGLVAGAGFARGSAECLELEGEALLHLVELVGRFDEGRVPPNGDLARAFRGYGTVPIRKHGQRASQGLRNGGLYRTRRGGPLTVCPLPETADGECAVADVQADGPCGFK